MKTITGKLKHGLKIGEKVHTDFEMREPTTADLFDAEDEHGTSSPLKFNGVLISLCLVRAGDYAGPFSFGMIRSLKQADFVILRDALQEAEKLGEG